MYLFVSKIYKCFTYIHQKCGGWTYIVIVKCFTVTPEIITNLA